MQHQNANHHQAQPAVHATPVVVQQTHYAPRPMTQQEKHCCCTVTKGAVCTFIIMMCIGGCALIGVGAARMVEQSHRYTKVDEYNADVADVEHKFGSGDDHFRLATTAGLNNLTVRQPAQTGTEYLAYGSAHEVTPVDSAWDVTKYTSYVYTAIVDNWVPNQQVQLTVNSDSSYAAGRGVFRDSILRGIPATKRIVERVECNIEACVDNCEHYMECDATSMQSYCERTFGTGATYKGEDECHDHETCGTCTYVGQLERVCVVMEDNFADGFNHHLDSCYYPFKADSQIYGAPSQFNHSVKVEFRSAADPFITMQRITEGTMSFGHPSEHVSAGTLLIIIGLALILVPTCGLCCYRCCCYEKKNTRRHAEDGQENDQVTTTTQVVPMQVAATPAATNPQFNQTQPTYAVSPAAAQPPAAAGQRQLKMQEDDQVEYGRAEYMQNEPAAAAAQPYGMVPEDENRLFGSRGSVSSGRSENLDDTHVVIEVPEKNKRYI